MNTHLKLSAKSKLTSKGQTTVPKEIRDALGLDEGASIEWVVDEGKVTVRAKTRNIADFAGILGKPPNGRHLSVEEMDDAVAQAVADRFERKMR